MTRLFEVLDHRPKFDAAAINVPIGLNDYPDGPLRPCDRDAQRVRRVAAAGGDRRRAEPGGAARRWTTPT